MTTIEKLKEKEDRNYFKAAEEKAVADYLSSNDEEEKNRIYNSKLHPALTKMIESIIRRYSLYVPDESSGQTFSDTMSYLMTKIHNFQPNKGKKAYSYFGTICKNYLLYKKIQFDKQQNRNVKYEDDVLPGEIDEYAYTYRDRDDFYYAAERIVKNISTEISSMVKQSERFQLNENEIKVGMALVSLLDNWQDILPNDDDSNKLQKSSILYYLREQTMMTTKEVRDNMKKYKAAYALVKKDALEN